MPKLQQLVQGQGGRGGAFPNPSGAGGGGGGNIVRGEPEMNLQLQGGGTFPSPSNAGVGGGTSPCAPPTTFLYQKTQGQPRPSKGRKEVKTGPTMMQVPCNAQTMEALLQAVPQAPLPQQAPMPGLDGFPYGAPQPISPMNGGVQNLQESCEMNMPMAKLNLPVPTTMPAPLPPAQAPQSTGLENFAQQAYSQPLQPNRH